jgi:hypothetical protein
MSSSFGQSSPRLAEAVRALAQLAVLDFADRVPLARLDQHDGGDGR